MSDIEQLVEELTHERDWLLEQLKEADEQNRLLLNRVNALQDKLDAMLSTKAK